MPVNSESTRKWLWPLHEIMLCLNLALAILYPLAAYGFERIPGPDLFDSGIIPVRYFFLRAAGRINSLLYLQYRAAAGRELAFSLSLLGIALLLIVLVRLGRRSSAHEMIVKQLGGSIAVFAVPAATLIAAAKVSSTLPFSRAGATLFETPLATIFAAEVVAVFVVWLLRRRKPLSGFVDGALLILHYAFWIPILWLVLSPAKTFFPLLALCLIFPGAGFIWLKARTSQQSPSDPDFEPIRWKPATLLAGSSCLLLCALWVSGRNLTLERARNTQSLMVEMSREGCFGSCPVYSVTMHGNGSVEYVGKNHVAAYGEQTTNISGMQLEEVLRQFDDVRFFALDDRAFENCYDTPKVTLTVVAGQTKKKVSSDTFCTGPKSGPQANLVSLAHQIDEIVGTDRWTKCIAPCGTRKP